MPVPVLLVRSRSIADASAARTVYEVNFWTPLALSAAVIPTMIALAREPLSMSLDDSVRAAALLGGYYGSSKSALAQATRALRLELAETQIRVIEVVPGATDTALRDIDALPWKDSAPKPCLRVSPESSAAAIVRVWHGESNA